MAGTLAVMVAGLWGRSHYSTVPETGLIIAAAASYVPLFLRNRWPIPVLIAVVALEVVHLVLQPLLTVHMEPSAAAAFQPVPVATMAAMYTVSVRKEPATAWLAGLLAAAALFVVTFVLYPTNLLATTLLMGNLVVITTAIGTTVRHRRMSRVRREQAHQQHVRQEVLAERMRIARELHDVLAHNLTLVNAQAGVANYLLETDPQAAQTALGNITVHTRRAIDDLRATVGLLREEARSPGGDQEVGASLTKTADNPQERQDLAPTHTLEHLPEMLEAFRGAGHAVSYNESGGVVSMPPLNDLSVYRIIQESLTNAAKHAPGAAISVDLLWAGPRLDISVINEPPKPTHEHVRAHRPAGRGHGLIGMRERALTAGGSFTAGFLPGGGYQVRVSIPTGQHINRGES